jgi:hypothetical protein
VGQLVSLYSVVYNDWSICRWYGAGGRPRLGAGLLVARFRVYGGALRYAFMALLFCSEPSVLTGTSYSPSPRM